MDKILAIILGGAIGAGVRYVLSETAYKAIGVGFPVGTLLVNLTGCFLVGWFSVLADKKVFHEPLGWLFLVVGFCGSMTTFSTFIFETSNLIRNGEMVRAFLNIVVSVVLGFIALAGGIKLGESF